MTVTDDMTLDEDGPFGIDLVRPGGEPFNGISAEQLERLGFVGGWLKSWSAHDRGVIHYRFDFGSPEAAAEFTASQAAVLVGVGSGVFEVPRTALGEGFTTFARELEHLGLAWAVTTADSSSVWYEARDHNASAALDLLVSAAS